MTENKLFDDTEFTIVVNNKFNDGDEVVVVDENGCPEQNAVVVSFKPIIVNYGDIHSVEDIIYTVTLDDDDEVELSEERLRNKDDEHCIECKRFVDTETCDEYVHHTNDGFICQDCEQQDLNYASTVIVSDPDQVGHKKYLVGEYVRVDTEYFEPADLEFNRVYKSTGGYRGHYETKIVDWVEVPKLTGWTTGGWGDEVGARKSTFNEWAENLMSEEEGDGVGCPVKVAIVCDPTSNVFSTAIGVWVPESDLEAFQEWLNGDIEDLDYSLS